MKTRELSKKKKNRTRRANNKLYTNKKYQVQDFNLSYNGEEENTFSSLAMHRLTVNTKLFQQSVSCKQTYFFLIPACVMYHAQKQSRLGFHYQLGMGQK